MKQIHKKIYRIRVAKVKKAAKQIKGFRTTFNSEQSKALNLFYHNNFITQFQARKEVLKMSNNKLFKLYSWLVKRNYNRHDIKGWCFNEKAAMILFCIGLDDNFPDLQDHLSDFYKTHPAFKNT